jgi:Protein kinase domain
MSTLTARLAAAQRLAERSKKQWGELCERYLPVTTPNSIWRYSRRGVPGDLRQGWKIHISATVLTANTVLSRVAPFLQTRSVLFKAPASLAELGKINCGLFYGYSQVGKFMTVYPQSDQEAATLATQLHELTQRISGPAVPFDLRYDHDGCVYYRYGAFQHLEIIYPDGSRMAAIRDPEGNLIADRRYSEAAKPEWVTDLFGSKPVDSSTSDSPLSSTYVGFAALVQRGKGGVYKAVDNSCNGPRFCVIKEGRKNGEVSWDGRDGHWRVKHETRVLRCLRRRGLPVPDIYDAFQAEQNYYLVTEFIAGESLQVVLQQRKRRYSLKQALRYSLELATLINRIHRSGWTWRDCKPSNIMLTPRGLRLIDFEGACPVSENDPVPWGTTPFVPPEWETNGSVRSGVYDDSYALGAVIYLLLYGKLPDAPQASEARLRKGIPSDVQDVVSKLLRSDPNERPNIETVVGVLQKHQLLVAGNSFIRCDSATNLGSRCSSSKIGSTLK